jgi:hypothetical protein
LPRQLSDNQIAQGRVACQLAWLGSAGAVQRRFISPGGAIGPEPSIPGNFAVARGNGSPQIAAKFPERATGNETARHFLAILPDDARSRALDPVNLLSLRRESGVRADLFGVRHAEFLDAQGWVIALTRIIRDEGVRIDNVVSSDCLSRPAVSRLPRGRRLG